MSMTERAYVVGTAGHVDHGKSTLVRALTGIDPDRLAEEKAREMTIDLGFAWLTLPSGQAVSIVDVPGHERFIKNMLAGVGGIDAALLVVAADEGPMPQTREHLAILDLLGIDRGIIVLTKADTVDEEFLELAAEATREAVQGTTLADAPLIATAATTGQGLDALKAALDALLAETPPRAPHGRPRLPVDRAFTISGFGTVVTGTLLDGTLAAGQEIELLPRGIRGRVRGVQTHQSKVSLALPGSRAAVNIGGVAVEEVRRGDVLTPPGWLMPTHLVDVYLRMTASAPPLEQNDPVDLFVGASEVQGRVTLLDADRLDAGDAGWVQLRLGEPVAVVRGDRFILRRPSPSETIGGGIIVDTTPRRHRRFHAGTLERLESLRRGTPEDLARQLLASGPREVREVIAVMGLEPATAHPVIMALIGGGELLVLPPVTDTLPPNAFLLMESGAAALAARLTALLANFHTANPLKRGMPREEAKSRLGLAPRLFDEFVAHLQRNGGCRRGGERRCTRAAAAGSCRRAAARPACHRRCAARGPRARAVRAAGPRDARRRPGDAGRTRGGGEHRARRGGHRLSPRRIRPDGGGNARPDRRARQRHTRPVPGRHRHDAQVRPGGDGIPRCPPDHPPRGRYARARPRRPRDRAPCRELTVAMHVMSFGKAESPLPPF